MLKVTSGIRTVYLNPEYIDYVYRSEEGTHVSMREGKYWVVEESVSTLVKGIDDHYKYTYSVS